MTHHRSPRDGSGRFVKRSPAEKVAAHVEKVNERHPAGMADGTGQITFTYTVQGGQSASIHTEGSGGTSQTNYPGPDVEDRILREQTNAFPARQRSGIQSPSAYNAFSEPHRSQPIEYARPDPFFLRAAFLWSAAAILLLLVIWVLAH